MSVWERGHAGMGLARVSVVAWKEEGSARPQAELDLGDVFT